MNSKPHTLSIGALSTLRSFISTVRRSVHTNPSRKRRPVFHNHSSNWPEKFESVGVDGKDFGNENKDTIV